MDLRHPDDIAFSDFVKKIVGHVRCELADAVNNNYDDNIHSTRHMIGAWAAKVQLEIKALDKGNFNPAVTALNPLGTIAFAWTGSLEADGLRDLTLTYFIPFAEMIDDRPHGPSAPDRRSNCWSGEIEPIAGDLGIGQTMQAALQTWDSANTIGDHVYKGPIDTISHHVNFIVIASAGETPLFKFATVTANTTPPFIGATRTRTDDLLITMGPTQLKDRVPPADGKKSGGKAGRPALQEIVPGTSLDDSFAIERLKGALQNRLY